MDSQERIFGLGEEFRSSVGDIWLMADPEFEQPPAGLDAGTSLSDDSFDQGNPYANGAKRSFLPVLGEIVWELPQSLANQVPFHAYIFRTNDGRQVGYVRVPHYYLDQRALNDFAGLVDRFERTTTAMVLDQVNNPGGNMFHMYSILSNLTDKPLALPKHQITIWDELVETAAKGVAIADSDDAERPGTRPSAELIGYYRFILQEHEAGRGRLTDPVHLCGVAEILPAKNHYSKKIVVPINALDFSAAEFLAAILQDNHRATMFGERTAGAGGCVRDITNSIPNLHAFGIASLTMTWTTARRTSGQPIEDLGVEPDVKYDITVDDLRSGYNCYREALLETVFAD